MNNIIHIDNRGCAYFSNSITSVKIKDDYSNSISCSLNGQILKFKINKRNTNGEWSTGLFEDIDGFVYSTNNIEQGWYNVTYNNTSTPKRVYLCKYDVFYGVDSNSGILTDRDNSININKNKTGLLTIQKVSNKQTQFSTIKGYTDSNSYSLSTSAGYLPSSGYFYSDNTLYQAVPYTENATGRYPYNDLFWEKNIALDNNGTILGGINFTEITKDLFVPPQCADVGQTSFCINYKSNVTQYQVSNALLASYDNGNTYLHGTFAVSYQSFDTSGFNYVKNNVIAQRSYIPNIVLQLNEQSAYCQNANTKFDLAFKIKSGDTDVSQVCDDLTFWVLVDRVSNSQSYAGTYPATYVPDCKYGEHYYSGIKDDYMHALIPWGQNEKTYSGINVSNSVNADFNGFYYYYSNNSNAFDSFQARYKNPEQILTLYHENGTYKIQGKKRIMQDYSSRYEYCLQLMTSDGKSTGVSCVAYMQDYDYDDYKWPDPADIPFTPDNTTFSFTGDSAFTGTLKKDFNVTPYNATKTLQFKVSDKSGNISSISVNKSVHIKKYSPINTYLQLTGSTGKNEYTGFYQKHNRFFPFSFITAQYSAADDEDMGVDIQIGEKTVISGKKVQSKKMNTSQLLLPEMDFGTGAQLSKQITLTFRDVAGNTAVLKKSIYQNNMISRLSKGNLVENSEKLKKNPNETLIVKTQISDLNTFYRAWNEFWFPDTHKLPTFENGVVNEQQALYMATHEGQWSTSQIESFDSAKTMVVSNASVLQRDNEGRILQTWTQAKQYGDEINDFQSLTEGLRSNSLIYYIVNSHDTSDFRLDFEYFDFSDTISQGKNRVAYNLGYKGDVLVVYDASTPGCTIKQNNNGVTTYLLKNPSLLKRMFAIKGSSSKGTISIKDLTDNELSNSWEKTDKGLITPAINSNLVCIIPYTDKSTTASGFKLKAGPKIQYEYDNYDINYETGQVWMHALDENDNYISISFSAQYRYYKNSVDIDYEKGTIILSDTKNDYPLIGNVHVYTYLSQKGNGLPISYMKNETILNFLATQDDFQDYSTPMFYCAPEQAYLSSRVKQKNYDTTQTNPYGRLSKFSVNKDEGILYFTGDTLPIGRIFGSYYYHTLYRLTSDGYGDLSFYQNILVPAIDDNYQDWTYVDLMIINQGTADLQSGTMKLLARGYVSSGTTVDTVLDNNRPWDQQQGSLQQTVNQCRGGYNASYLQLKKDLPVAESGVYNAATGRKTARGTKNSTIAIGALNTKSAGFIRIFWTLAQGAEGNAWIQCTRGNKLFSAELAGTYNSFSTN